MIVVGYPYQQLLVLSLVSLLLLALSLSKVFTGGFLLLLTLAMCLMAQGQLIWTATHAQ